MRFRSGAGMRAIHVSLELIEEFLHGRTKSVIAENVPKDMTVFGSIKAKHQPDSVVFLCQSEEWDPGQDFTADGEHAMFEPIYRRAG